MEDLIYIEKESVKKMIQRLGGATKCEMIALLAFMPRVQIKTNEDVISRSDAIKWFEPYADRGLKIPVETVIQNLKDIPSADKQGEWLFKEITDDYHVIGQCSICKERRRIDNFCPNCGCRMKGADDDAD